MGRSPHAAQDELALDTSYLNAFSPSRYLTRGIADTLSPGLLVDKKGVS